MKWCVFGPHRILQITLLLLLLLLLLFVVVVVVLVVFAVAKFST